MNITSIQWKPIRNGYFVSNSGLIRDSEGNIVPAKQGRRVLFGVTPVARLVAMAFLPNPMNLPNVIHMDGVQSNVSVDNLQWASREDTDLHMSRVRSIYGYHRTNKPQPVVAVSNSGSVHRFPSIAECARRLGFHKRIIQDSLKHSLKQCADWSFSLAESMPMPMVTANRSIPMSINVLE